MSNTSSYEKKIARVKNARNLPFPVMGMRIVKTAFAVFLCLVIYILRGYQGMVIQSTIASIICMQPYNKDSLRSAVNRVIGTVLGAFAGLVYLLTMRLVVHITDSMLVAYIIMAIGVALVFYFTVAMKLSDSASLAAIVYLCIIIAYPDIVSPLATAVDRTIDTIIGVCVAIVVNEMHLPRQKHPEKVFFVRLQDLVEDRFAQVPSRILIALNRLYDDGAKICLETRWAPAFLISQMGTTNINMPVIVMDGTALYDLNEKKYYEVEEIDHADADVLCGILEKKNLGCNVFAIREHAMLIFRVGPISVQEQEDFLLLRRSPYRNYVDGMWQEEDHITNIRFLVSNQLADETEDWLMGEKKLTSRFRMERREQPRANNTTGFYFYRKDTSVSRMEEKVIQYIREERHETAEHVCIRPMSSAYEPERDAGNLLNRVKGCYERPDILKMLRRKS